MKPTPSIIAALALMPAISNAARLVHDPFDYSNDNTPFDGQSSTARTGFANGDAWTVDVVGASTVNLHSSPGSLTYSTLQTSGGHAMAFRNSGVPGFPRVHSLDSSTDFTNYASNEIWWSIVVNADGYNPSGSEYFEFNWDHQVSGGDRLFGFRLENSKEVQALRYSGAYDNTGATLAAGNNLLVFRMTNNTGSSTNFDEIEMWLNPDLSSIGAADFSTEGSFYGLVQGNNSYGFDGINITYDLSDDDSVLIDEFRLGENLVDVIPENAPIPEPSTALMLALAMTGMMARRRRA